MRNVGILVLALLSASLVTGQATGQPNAYGRITGTVLDENGQLVDDASVCTSVAKGGEAYITCNVSTDQNGQFQIDHLNVGTYGVFATKEEDGYSGYQQRGHEVTITTVDPNAYITLRLGPKGGILTGSVKDTQTGKPIVTSQVFYVLLDGRSSGSAGVNDEGGFQITVPPRTDVVIAVSARGYKGWVYTDAANPSRPVLRLGSGEKKVLDVELERVPADGVDK